MDQVALEVATAAKTHAFQPWLSFQTTLIFGNYHILVHISTFTGVLSAKLFNNNLLEKVA